MASPSTEVQVGPHEVRVTNPDRVYFSARGETKLDLVDYYLAVAPGIVRAVRDRPCMLHRYPSGTDGEKIYQKRLPKGAPEWVETVQVRFPSGRTADELCVTKPADIVWAVQMSTVEFHPWHSRRSDTERPDELAHRPRSAARAPRLSECQQVVAEVVHEASCPSWARWVGPRPPGRVGMHIYVRIEPDPRLHARCDAAALAFAREIERRVPSSWSPRRGGRKNAATTGSSWTTTRTPVTARSPRRTRCVGRRSAGCRHR